MDTNTFIAAGFNRRSASARIIQQIRDGRLQLVWNDATRAETRTVAKKIPPIRWEEFADLFRNEYRFDGETDENVFGHVPDPADRKFAALAAAAGAVLITQDDHLLGTRDRGSVRILAPGEFWAGQRGDD